MIYLVTLDQQLFDIEQYKIIGVEESLSLLNSMSIIGVDTETSGLNCHNDRLLSAQFGNFDNQVVVDCSTVDIRNYKDLLEDKTKLFLFWNAKFDLKFFYSNGIIPYNVYDGFLAEKLMWLGYPSGFHSMSLKTASEEYLGVYRDKTIRGKIIWNGMKSVDTIVYAAEDVQYLEAIMIKQKEKLKEKGLLTAIQYENKFVLALAYEEWCGVKVDIDKWKAKMAKDNARLDKAKKALDKWFIEEFNTYNLVQIELRASKTLNTIYVPRYADIRGLQKEYIEALEEKKRMEAIGATLVESGTTGDDANSYYTYLVGMSAVPTAEMVNTLYKKYIFIDYQGDLWDGYNTEPQVLLNWNSAKQVIPILKLYGVELEVQDKEKGGTKDSIDAKVLKPQKNKCSLIPLLLDYKEAVKVTSTYGENFLKQIDKKTGRLYSQFNQLGADTTRITSGGKDKAAKVEYINLLNLPSDKVTRSCFCAENGNRWISMDYSGQETYIMASVTGDEALLKELNEGAGDIHSLTAYLSYKEIPRDTPIAEIKHKYHDLRQEAKGIEFAINYGGDANTISSNKGIPIEEANKIYNAYMDGFKGVKKYQDFRRKDVMQKGYILLNPLTGHKAYIYDFDELQQIKSRFNQEFWTYYREMKQSSPNCDTVQDVRKFFKRKSASEKQSINYPIQATGSLCLRVSMVNFFEYLRRNNLLFKVLITVTPYDEINCEAPEEIANDVAKELYNCMVKAGAYFCTKCKLDADISWNKIEVDGQEVEQKGVLPTYWIH